MQQSFFPFVQSFALYLWSLEDFILHHYYKTKCHFSDYFHVKSLQFL